jgi:predicted DNA-binding protein
MATTKTRINISLSDDVEKALKALAKRDQVPSATKAAELLRLALEIEEDYVFSKIADDRLAEKNIKWLKSEEVWGK